MKLLDSFDNKIYSLPNTFTAKILGGIQQTTTSQTLEQCTGSACDTVTETSDDEGKLLQVCVRTDTAKQC